ncbi:hypothetical protein CRYUN_Cryun13aG0045800 [Craigia yunnanensis]
MIAKFWWERDGKERCIHWLSWESLCVSTLDGGLGFKDFEAFNLAVLAKRGWCLIQNTVSLCYKVFNAKYFPNGSFMDAEVKYNASFVWKSLIEGRKVLELGLKWRIGDGCSVNI